MAEASLKLGGSWATKEGSLLGFNDENGNYKPIPFDFTRATTATRVNRDGLIEEVQSGVPRIDFSNGDGSLLLEPQRTNLVPYSEDLTQWNDYNASAVLSDETIYGQNAYKIVEDSTVNFHGIYLPNLFSADGTNYIWSVYVKGAERRYVVLTARYGISSNDSALIFDTQDGVWVLDSSSQNQALSAESLGNGWWRISIEGDPTSGAYDSYTIASAIGFNSYNDANYQGDGTSGIYVAMPQVEAGSYPTSYIKTSGSAVTRNVESAVKTLGASYFPTNGISVFVDFDVTHSSVTNFADLYQLQGSSAQLRLETRTFGRIYIQQGNMVTSGDNFNAYNLCPSTAKKICLTFSSTQVKAYVDGVLINTWNGSYTWDFTDLNMPMQASTAAYNNTMLFPSTLSNQEAIDLTTL